MYMVVTKATSSAEAENTLESYLLDDPAMQVNDAVLLNLSFTLMKINRSSKHEEVSHEKVCNEPCSQIHEPADIRTRSRYLPDAMIKSIQLYVERKL